MKKVIIITGAGSGIGKASAFRLVEAGHTVYGADLRLEHMDDLAKAGGHPVLMDVTDHDQVRSEINQIIEKEARVDVLVNNAGYGLWGSIEETPYEKARQQFEVNLFGLAEVTKAVIPTMRKQKSGTIINLSSVGGMIHSPLGAWYHASKFALEGWSDCLRVELMEFGIDVVIIQPGNIKTDFHNEVGKHFTRPNDSPYASLANAITFAQDEIQKPGNSSPPSLIANMISKAVHAKKPKTRYTGGKLARETIFFRKRFPDRFFDKTILRMIYKRAGK